MRLLTTGAVAIGVVLCLQTEIEDPGAVIYTNHARLRDSLMGKKK